MFAFQRQVILGLSEDAAPPYACHDHAQASQDAEFAAHGNSTIHSIEGVAQRHFVSDCGYC